MIAEITACGIVSSRTDFGFRVLIESSYIYRVAQSEFRKILRFREVAKKVHSPQPKRFTRSLKSGGGGGGGDRSRTQYEKIRRFVQNRFFCVEYRGLESAMGGGVVAEPSKTKSVDSAINHFFVRGAIKIRRKQIFP